MFVNDSPHKGMRGAQKLEEGENGEEAGRVAVSDSRVRD